METNLSVGRIRLLFVADALPAELVRIIEFLNEQMNPAEVLGVELRQYTGGRHTYASQYLRVEGNPNFVLASDNCYLYRNLAEHKASGTFSKVDQPANIQNQARMIELAGSADRVIPGHDALQFQKFPTEGRIARIK